MGTLGKQTVAAAVATNHDLRRAVKGCRRAALRCARREHVDHGFLIAQWRDDGAAGALLDTGTRSPFWALRDGGGGDDKAQAPAT